MVELKEVIRLISEVKKIDPELSLQQLHCLFVIAQNNEISLTDIAKAVGISLPTASRYVSSLGNYGRGHNEGSKLVEAYENPMERRKKIIRLSNKGRVAVNKITEGALQNADLSKR